MVDNSINKVQIKNLLPHREPMLLIDELTDIVKLKSATAIMNVSKKSFFVDGHFPENPVMPGVLIIEAMAQTAAIVVVDTLENKSAGNLVYFMTIDEARFRKPVVPGDTMHIRVTKVQSRKTVWKFKGEAKVNDILVAEAIFSAMIVEPK